MQRFKIFFMTYQNRYYEQCEHCNFEKLQAFIWSEDTQGKVSAIRTLANILSTSESLPEVELKKLEEELKEQKKSLPLIIPQAADFDESIREVNSHGEVIEVKGKWRRNETIKFNGLDAIDLDHIPEPPIDYYNRWNEKWGTDEDGTPRLYSELGIMCIYRSCSGRGLKVIFKADPSRGDLWDNQVWMARELGVEEWLDPACSDISHGHFLSTKEDFYFLREEMFTYNDTEFERKYGDELRRKNAAKKSTKTKTSVNNLSTTLDEQSWSMEDVKDLEKDESGNICFLHTPYINIIREYEKSDPGSPYTGQRHTWLLRAVGNFRYITDDNPALLYNLMSKTVSGGSLIESGDERELKRIITDIIKKPRLSGIPKNFREIIDRAASASGNKTEVKSIEKDDSIYNHRDHKYWAQRASELGGPGLDEAREPLPSDNQLMGDLTIIPTVGTALSQCTFLDLQGNIDHFNFQVNIFGESGSGKGEVGRMVKIIMRKVIERERLLRKQEDEYKDKRNEFQFSGKRGKAKSPQRPKVIVRYVASNTSFAALFRRIKNAQGLHLFMYESEISEMIASKKSDWKDLTVIELKAFHCEEYGVERAGSESDTGLIDVKLNTIATGTMNDFFKKFEGVIGSGQENRIIPYELPQRDLEHIELDTFHRTDENKKKLESWWTKLERANFQIECNELRQHVLAWYNHKVDVIKEDFDSDEVHSKCLIRIDHIMMRFALVRAIMRQADNFMATGTVEFNQSDFDYADLIGDYVFAARLNLFGNMLSHHAAQSKAKQTPNEKLTQPRRQPKYDRLPDEFTINDVMQKVPCSTENAARAWISRLKKNVKKVISADKEKWQKVNMILL